jgi:alpha-tubulin suppressor-like RCC1 family protein
MPFATAVCSQAGACAVAACSANHGDCDGDPGNGCEADLSTPLQCGACGNACPVVAHGSATCQAGACGVSCQVGFQACPTGCCVAVIERAVSISGGAAHTCVVTDEGAGRCWGANDFGQIGDGTHNHALTPSAVVGLSGGVSLIAAGHYHTCAYTATGVDCWGKNTDGQLGDGSSSDSTVPVPVAGLDNTVSAVYAGAGDHTCVAFARKAPQCWGLNLFGELGDGTTAPAHLPVPLGPLAGTLITIAPGYTHTCALEKSGVECWGLNADGELGNGTTVDAHVPASVVGLASPVTQVAAGFSHTCAVVGGGVKCWGSNAHGELGNNSTLPSSAPVDVSGLGGGVVALAAGNQHTCALLAGGAVRCWGANDWGQLGDGSTTAALAPVDVTGVSGASALAAGISRTCAILRGGGVRCWGFNNLGGLGDGTTTSSSVAVTVVGFP